MFAWDTFRKAMASPGPIGSETPASGVFTTLSVNNDISVGGTVDGRDIASDGSKLDELYSTIGLSALTSAEVDQLENIGSTTISSTQWGYLGELDQSLKQAASPTFKNINLSDLSTGYLPYHTASGLADSPIKISGNDISVDADADIDPDVFPDLPSDEGLVGYWSFDDGTGTKAIDGSGNGNDGTVIDAQWGEGYVYTPPDVCALRFNGVSDYIDFGDIELGDFKDSTLSLFIKNISKKEIIINSIKLTGPDDKHFRIMNINEFNKIASGQSKSLSLRFIPEQLTLDNSKLVINYQGAGQECVVSLIGQGIKPRIDTATISIASFSGLQNNIYEVPIKISNLSELGFRPTITGFQLDLKYNATMLDYLGDYIESNVNGFYKTITIQLPATFDSDSVLAKLRFKVALGNDTITPLILSNVSLLGKGKTMLSLESGEFKLQGYCKKGGVRLFESNGKIVLSQNRPNPFEISTTIEFEVFEFQ